jgi:hypothetical protein
MVFKSSGEVSQLRKVQISGLDFGPQNPTKWQTVSDGEWKLIVEGDKIIRLYYI